MDIEEVGTVIRKGSGLKPRSAAPAPAPKPRQKKDPSGEKQVSRVHCKVTNCRYSTPHPKDLVRHMRKHNGEKPFSCDVCFKAFSRQDKLKQHKRTHEGNKASKCSQCSYSCVEPSAMKRHERVHSNEKPFKCQLCPYSAKNSVELTIHTRFHTGDSPYTCPAEGCNKAFKTPSDLQRHSRSRSHSGLRPHACSKCDYRTGIKCNLVAHIKRHHPEPPSSVIIVNPTCQEPLQFPIVTAAKVIPKKRPLPSPSPVQLPFDLACKTCTYKCETIKAFKIHMTKKHRSTNYPLLEEFEKLNKLSKGKTKKVKSFKFPKVFECSKCPATFVNAESLKCHMKQHGIVAPRPVPRFQLLSPNPQLPPDEDSILVPNGITTIDQGHLQTINHNYYQFQTSNTIPYLEPVRYTHNQ